MAIFADQIKIVEGWKEGEVFGYTDSSLPESIRQRLKPSRGKGSGEIQLEL
jgi:hypothetical protein